MTIENTIHKVLKFKDNEKLPIHQLPFIGFPSDHLGLSYWDVPKTGGYSGGNTTGKALAKIYLKYISENGAGGGTLQHIAFDLFDFDKVYDRKSQTPELNAMRGQAVGFFVEIERWLYESMNHFKKSLHQMDYKDLLHSANDGLFFDEDAYMSALSDEEE